MKVVCSCCRCDLGQKEPLEDNSISHGMCDDCYDYFDKQLDGMSYDEYLKQFDYPVVMVNLDGRVISVNDRALTLLGKPKDKLRGYLGGEVFECVYARLPEGCGETTHCETCTIRNLVQMTFDTQRNYVKKVVRLQTDDALVEMVVSTSIKEGVVTVEIHEIYPVAAP